jgi:transcription elongation factor GreB
MSKAFLPEDSAAPTEPALPPRPAERLPITPEGHRRLLAERAGLAHDEATRTRARLLDRVLATVEVTPPALREDGGAGFGCELEVRDERGRARVYRLVGTDEVDAAAGHISPDSPLGRALYGRRAGDVVTLERGGREEELEVLAVRLPG